MTWDTQVSAPTGSTSEKS